MPTSHPTGRETETDDFLVEPSYESVNQGVVFLSMYPNKEPMRIFRLTRQQAVALRDALILVTKE